MAIGDKFEKPLDDLKLPANKRPWRVLSRKHSDCNTLESDFTFWI